MLFAGPSPTKRTRQDFENWLSGRIREDPTLPRFRPQHSGQTLAHQGDRRDKDTREQLCQEQNYLAMQQEDWVKWVSRG
jgi:hypothetical protein